MWEGGREGKGRERGLVGGRREWWEGIKDKLEEERGVKGCVIESDKTWCCLTSASAG